MRSEAKATYGRGRGRSRPAMRGALVQGLESLKPGAPTFSALRPGSATGFAQCLRRPKLQT
eukprot:13799950-Alexandrium_andersonii.AAC.1